MCTEPTTFSVSLEAYVAYQGGRMVQNVFPDLPIDLRELLISGTCGPCFASLGDGADEDFALEEGS
jgi:hypothetical protein